MTDILDKAQAVEEKDREYAIKRALSKRNDIEIINEIRNGQAVRVCAECGTDIPIKRIKALPLVALCFECQSAKEK